MTPIDSLGLYLHVPFCATRCDFCAFYEEAPRRPDIDRYLAAVEREARLWQDAANGQRPTTVFWGGGTPGLLPAKDLERLGLLMLDLCDPVEWTIELAPSAVKADKLRVLRQLGLNRVSLGVQSFQPVLLEALGRRHQPAQIHRAYAMLRAEGFASVNLDLMFALPGQSRAQWQADLDAALVLAPDHLSTYCLTFEEDTALWAKLSQGRVKRDEAAEAELYRFTWEYLAAAGMAQYEISNFARPGHRCAHNLGIWHMGDWIGFGPSAASQWAGQRYRNPASINAWAKAVDKLPAYLPAAPHHEDRVPLSPSLRAIDALIFGLRLNEGVEEAWLKHLPEPEQQSLRALFARLRAYGLMGEGQPLRLSTEGRLRADAIGTEILSAVDEC